MNLCVLGSKSSGEVNSVSRMGCGAQGGLDLLDLLNGFITRTWVNAPWIPQGGMESVQIIQLCQSIAKEYPVPAFLHQFQTTTDLCELQQEEQRPLCKPFFSELSLAGGL